MTTVEEIIDTYKQVQDAICNFLVETTGQQFLEDPWEYNKGTGGGRTRVWEYQSGVIEKGGVNFSAIYGDQLPTAAIASAQIPNSSFVATGVSIVIHPSNPHVPTIHMNIRYFEAGGQWWFGGGIDVTPYYPVKSQVIEFHRKLKNICEKYKQDYEKLKEECDKYFFLSHRNETRGVGGIFFDQFSANDSVTKGDLLAFTRDLGYGFIDIYRMFLENTKNEYCEKQREFQLIRRSRYVEFNLLFDRGTKFGIQSQGRTESILMSMPTTAIWKYNWSPDPDSEEAKFMSFYLKPQNWLEME